ncbi:hypothetical protein COPCOM_02055 [Coprococcus comes ATCC 27758]|uniref:Uncharacterized protein n=1 Tax=Coprococcus comes ATCC 27758 TaxID=470146 RepID=C0BAF4_9FIRM|nr:hypothetical protein COPCOM_02055 [Coprococcus comes ATCC 27758]
MLPDKSLFKNVLWHIGKALTDSLTCQGFLSQLYRCTLCHTSRKYHFLIESGLGILFSGK